MAALRLSEPPSLSRRGEADTAWRTVSNSFYAIVEFAWPVGVALLVTPLVVRGLGPSSFGVLSVVGITVGLFGLLDLGLGGAATRALAQTMDEGDLDSSITIVGTVVTAYLLIGLAGAGAIALATPLLVSTVLNIPDSLKTQAELAFYISSVGFPVSLLVGALGSVPKAAQRFDISTRVSIVFSTLAALVTVSLVARGYGVGAVAGGALFVSALAAATYYGTAARLLGIRWIPVGVHFPVLRELAAFGGWFIVASAGVVVLYQFDKLVLGAFLSVAAVTYYVVPGSLASRVQGALAAATHVIFPLSAALARAGRVDQLVQLYLNGTRLTFLLAATLAVPMSLFADRFLLEWLGRDFLEESTLAMVLLVGTYGLLGMAGVAWGIAFGSGRSKTNAIFVMGMAILDVVTLFVVVVPYGINGASFAFFLSALIGVPALIAYVERHILGLDGREFLRQYMRLLPAIALQMFVGVLLRQVAQGLALTIVSMAATAAALPLLYLRLGIATPTDRRLVDAALARILRRRTS